MIEYRIRFGYSVKITKEKIEWYLNRKRHRDVGPAVENANVSKYWCVNGKKDIEWMMVRFNILMEISNGISININIERVVLLLKMLMEVNCGRSMGKKKRIGSGTV